MNKKMKKTRRVYNNREWMQKWRRGEVGKDIKGVIPLDIQKNLAQSIK